jgi:hypothetical protein
MKGIKKYGKTSQEESVECLIEAREIVQEILRFGVTQAQILQIAYLLSLELESVTALKEISACVQRHKEGANNPATGIITNI